jgi:hypothetical protein
MSRCLGCGADLALVGRVHNCRGWLDGAAPPAVPRPDAGVRLEAVCPAGPPRRGGARVGAGRKRKGGARPWEAEGISRAAWYKRRRRDA